MRFSALFRLFSSCMADKSFIFVSFLSSKQLFTMNDDDTLKLFNTHIKSNGITFVIVLFTCFSICDHLLLSKFFLLFHLCDLNYTIFIKYYECFRRTK